MTIEITWTIEKDSITQYVNGKETIRIIEGGGISLKDGISRFEKTDITTGDPVNPTHWNNIDTGTINGSKESLFSGN